MDKHSTNHESIDCIFADISLSFDLGTFAIHKLS